MLVDRWFIAIVDIFFTVRCYAVNKKENVLAYTTRWNCWRRQKKHSFKVQLMYTTIATIGRIVYNSASIHGVSFNVDLCIVIVLPYATLF